MFAMEIFLLNWLQFNSSQHTLFYIHNWKIHFPFSAIPSIIPFFATDYKKSHFCGPKLAEVIAFSVFRLLQNHFSSDKTFILTQMTATNCQKQFNFLENRPL